MKEFDEIDELTLFALGLYGECRSEKIDAKVAHASAIWNRHNNARKSLREVLLTPKHFSCFNEGDPNLNEIRKARDSDKKNAAYRECYWAAYGVMFGYLRDNTGGADHYNTVNVDPAWDDKMVKTAQFGKTEFFREA